MFDMDNFDQRMAAIDPGVLDGTHPRIDRLRPLARLGRDEWGLLGEIREITRIPSDDWPGHYARPGDQ